MFMTSQEKYAKNVMKPNFKDEYPFLKESFAVEMRKTEIKMNKPVHLGQAILNLNKTLICQFNYDYIQSKNESKVMKVCCIDIDIFVYEIEKENF